MARKIRFPLKMKNGEEVRTLDELKENFDLESVLGYFTDGKLVTWLADRYYDDKAKAVSALSADMSDLNAKLCEILEVEYQAEEDETDLELIARRREKLQILSSITDNREILDNVDIVVMSQDELFDILDESPEKVYLYGEKFNIPSGKKNVSYVGINDPEVFLEKDKSKKEYKKLGILFSDVKLDDIMCSGEELFLSGKPQEAFKIIKEAAENGDPRSMYIMGLYYDGGYETVKINEYERNKWYKKALPYNYPLSTFRYANDCLNSRSLPFGCSDDFRNSMKEQQKKIFSQVVNEIEAMAEAGDVFAQAELGWIYFAGLGVEDNENKSAEWYRKAADNGSAFAQTDLAIRYTRGQGVPKDLHTAVELSKKASDKGYARAQHNLSALYSEFDEIPKDTDMATELLYRAVMQESEKSLDYLIGMNRNNDIRLKDDSKVIALLEKLAEQGSVIAQYTLGRAYDSIFPISKDKDKAIMWYKKAADQGHADAQHNLGRLYKLSKSALGFGNDKTDAKDWSESIKWFTKAAEQGKISSQYELGKIYEELNDRDKAVYWYKMAAENGLEDAIEKLKNRPPRKLISGFKINDSADQIQPQGVTHSAITIGIFHNPKNLDLSIDVFNENAFM